MKVMFLDFDGVLLSMMELQRRHKEIMMGRDIENDAFDPNNVDNLNLILSKDPDLKIVISSTWRIGRTIEELKQILQDNGIDPNRVVDKTETDDEKNKGRRGVQIQNWLKKHPEVTKYVILDDDGDMLPKQQSCFVRTSGYRGLTTQDAVQAMQILGINPF